MWNAHVLNLGSVYLIKSVLPLTFVWSQVTYWPGVAMTYSEVVQYEPVNWQAQWWPFLEQKLQPFAAVRVKFSNMSQRHLTPRYILLWSSDVSWPKSFCHHHMQLLCMLFLTFTFSFLSRLPFSFLSPPLTHNPTCTRNSHGVNLPLDCWDSGHTFPLPVHSLRYCISLFQLPSQVLLSWSFHLL